MFENKTAPDIDTVGLRTIATAASLAKESMGNANRAMDEAKVDQMASDIASQIIVELPTKLLSAAKEGQFEIEVDFSPYQPLKRADDEFNKNNRSAGIRHRTVSVDNDRTYKPMSELGIETAAVNQAKLILTQYAEEKGLIGLSGKKLNSDRFYINFDSAFKKQTHHGES